MNALPGCVLCGGPLGSRGVELYPGPPVVGGDVHICGRCGSGVVVPMPSAEALNALYSRDYYEGYAEGPGMAGGDRAIPAYLGRRLARLESYAGRGRILDVGCGLGLFVAYAREHGWDAVGLETSRWAATEGMKRYGIRIVSEPLERADLGEGSFDVIHANHVLEHLPDPIATLRAALQLLRPGGVFFAEVPQELHVPFATRIRQRLRPTPATAKNFHLVFFSRRGLRVAFERAGFVLEHIANTGHPDVLRGPAAVARGAILIAERVVERAPAFEAVARRTPEIAGGR